MKKPVFQYSKLFWRFSSFGSIDSKISNLHDRQSSSVMVSFFQLFTKISWNIFRMSESLLAVPSVGFITILKPNTSVYYIIDYLNQED